MTEFGHPAVLERAGLDALIAALRAAEYVVVGPVVRDSAVVYDEITSAADLPQGWTDEQNGGTYRLRRRDDGALFGYAVGPHSWKRFLYPPHSVLWTAERDAEGFTMRPPPEQETPAYAFLGVRACELRAIEIQDRVFLGNGYADPAYAARRARAFIVAVNCSSPAGTCFCVSMETGPRAETGFDLALTEITAGDTTRFLVETGSERGAQTLASVPHETATADDSRASDAVIERASNAMGRELDTFDIRDLLQRNAESKTWDRVAQRCLACTNCTMVCPTCFCGTVEDATDLTGNTAQRARRWDSCFTMDFSRLHGGSVRSSIAARYRQWMTHKLSTWIDQFGSSGCVGCGRCITWCPVGIDITEEVRAIRDTEGSKK
ncbi:MAG: 4Fe-4S dicluster domain-containing protein [Actinomycetota bacterium]